MENDRKVPVSVELLNKQTLRELDFNLQTFARDLDVEKLTQVRRNPSLTNCRRSWTDRSRMPT